MRLIVMIPFALAGLWFAGCFGGAGERLGHHSYPLGFERPVERDTADFVHLHFDQYPLSLEVMGRVSLPFENSYTLMLQVGIYAAPGFDSTRLEIAPESLVVTAGGLRPAYQSPGRISWGQPPWAAMSTVTLVFNYDSLLARVGDSAFSQFEIRLPHHLVYDGQQVPVEPMTALGFWITRPIRHTEN